METPHGSLHQLSVTMSRGTKLTVRAHIGTGVGNSQQKILGRGFGKNVNEWTGRVEIGKKEIPGSRRSMRGYIRTCSRLKRENL